jgi:hypothetical protein
MSSENFTINLIRVNECLGINFYSGSIRLEDLFANFDVPIYQKGKDVTSDDGGYQREAKPPRVALVAQRIIEPNPGQILPNTESFVDNINLNLRTEAAEEAYIKPIDASKTGFGDIFTFDYISTLGKFQIVDGQTRVKGAFDSYRKAIDSKEYELADKIKNLRLQITLTFTESRFKEAYVFYLINQYSQKIPTEGAIRLLYEGMIKGDIDFVNEVSRSNKTDEVEIMKIIQKLSDQSDVWCGHIADFNEKDKKNKIPINTFTRITKNLYKKIDLSVQDGSQIDSVQLTYEIIEAFWCGLKLAYPEMFQIHNLSKFNILKGVSVEVLMKVLEQIFDYNLNGTLKLNSLKDESTYEELMKKTLDSFKEKNGFEKLVSGSDLFRVGSAGVFGSYGNSVQKNMAKEKIMTTMLNAK